MGQIKRKKKRKILIGCLAPGGARNLKSSRSAEIHDEFTTPEAAPLTSPRSAEPGPGVTTFVDTENKLSIVAEGILRCSGGKASPSYGDPGIWLGAEELSHIKAPGNQIPHLMRPGMGVAQFISFADAGNCLTGFDLGTAGDLNLPRWYYNLGVLKIQDSVSARAYGAITLDVMTKFVMVQRSKTNGYHFIQDGKLLLADESPAIGDGYAAVSNNSAIFDLHDIGFVDLADDGYTNDFADVTDSESSPGVNTDFACNADFLIEYDVTHQTGVSAEVYFRRIDVTNWVSVQDTGSGTIRVSKRVLGSISTLFTSSSILSNGVAFNLKITAEGSTIKVWVDDVSLTTQEVPDHATVAQGRLQKSSWAADDSVLSSHPYPALGIAHNHIICPQAAETADHVEESIAIEIKDIRLPTDVVVAELRFRDGGGNHISVKWNQAGNVDVEDNGTPICAGVGVIADGEDIFVILDGNAAKLYANRVLIQENTIVTALTGTGFVCQSMQDGAGAGQVNVWPANPPLPDGLK